MKNFILEKDGLQKPDTVRLIMTMEGMKEEYDAALEESTKMTEHLK